MADILKAEVTLPYLSGLDRDVSINVFHFLIADGNWEDASLAAGLELSAFYNTIWDLDTDGDWSVADFIGSVVDRSADACKIQYYGAQADPQVLLFEERFTLGGDVAAAGTLPLESSICASFTATPGGVVPKGRRRGRVYIGPLTAGAMVSIVGGGAVVPFVNPIIAEVLVRSMEQMAGESTEAIWAIYSRAADAAFEVTGGWVDNELDTQRRRQLEASSRVSWGLPY